MVNQRHCEANGYLCKRLAKTNAFSSKEGREGKRIAGFTIWREKPSVVFLGGIESFRHKASWLSPLSGISMDFPETSHKHLVFLEVHLLVVEFESDIF